MGFLLFVIHYFALQSGAVKNSQPSFIFTVKSNDVDSRVIHGGQLVNHFGKARSFTTKVCGFSLGFKFNKTCFSIFQCNYLHVFYLVPAY